MSEQRVTREDRGALIRWLALALLLVSCGLACSVRADAALDVSKPLEGVSLGRRFSLLEDPTRSLGIADVVSSKHTRRFVRGVVEAPSLGFTSSVYWLRLSVENPSSHMRSWLLELSYPLLDEVTLYVPRAGGGFEARETGDMRPFSQRDIAYRNFVFSLEEPAGVFERAAVARTYYLRIASSGPMNLPVVAWTMREFLEHQHLDWTMLCIFYGVILVMILYGACVYLFAKQPEYLPYVGYMVSIAFAQFTLAGHTFQFLLPNAPWLVHRLLPASVAAALLFGNIVVQTYLPRDHTLQQFSRGISAYCCLLFALSFALPSALLVRITHGTLLMLSLVAIAYGIELVRIEGTAARLFVLGWGSAIVGAIVFALQAAGYLPQTFLTDWCVQIGVALQLVLLSSALADKINSARADLSSVHAHLSHKLVDLSAALEAAEQASLRAERATQLKDDFLATMSHEFRTPLNPIINIPQQIRQEFLPVRHAVCSHCASCFELDDDEHLTASSVCPDCAHEGTLVAQSALRYAGDALRTRRFLSKIERSGTQLLEVVNGILEFSKLQAGHLELVREPVEVGELVRELVRDKRAPASQRELAISCVLRPPSFTLVSDAQRLRQVLAILLDNAIKYSDRPGSITVRAELAPAAYRVSVSDQGIGIASEHFETIFESFEQVSKGNTRRYGGTGLGLSIARSLSRMLGGDLTVQSVPGQGSTFTVTLPRPQVSLAGASLARPSASQSARPAL